MGGNWNNLKEKRGEFGSEREDGATGGGIGKVVRKDIDIQCKEGVSVQGGDMKQGTG